MINFIKLLEACKEKKQFEIIDHISKAQPFVFDSFKKTGIDTVYTQKLENLDLPFRICSFELSGENAFYYKIENIEYFFTVIVAEEIEPQKIIFYALVSLGNGSLTVVCAHPDDHSRKGLWLILRHSILECLNRLKTQNHGFSSPKAVFKWKENGEKKQVRINKIIYVQDSKQSESLHSFNRTIQWSHAFWVMGHWRNIDGIGKDRDGNYLVKGKTWITSFVKNAELGDPITKIRLKKEIQ